MGFGFCDNMFGYYFRQLLKIKLGGAELNEAKPHQLFRGCLTTSPSNDTTTKLNKS